MEGAIAEEILDVDFVFLHVVQREPLRIGRRDKYHGKVIIIAKDINHIKGT